MEEMILERQLNSKTYRNEDGTRTIKYFGNNVHFDKNGVLEEIDVNFYLNSTSTPAYYLYNTINNTFRIGLTSDLSVDKAIKFSFRYDGLGDIYTTLKGMALYDSEKDEYTIFQTPQPNESSILSNVATYENVYTGVNFEIHSLQDKLKEYIYLNDINNIPNPVDYGYNPDKTYIIFLNHINTNLLDLQVNDLDELEVYNEGIKKLTSPKEWAKDNNKKDLDIINKYDVNSGKYYFGISYNQLLSANLPITIDPTWQTTNSETSTNYDVGFEVNLTDASYSLYKNYSNVNFGTDSTYDRGYGIKFDISSFGFSSDYIKYAFFYTMTTSDAIFQIRKINQSWDLNSGYSVIKDAINNSTVLFDNESSIPDTYLSANITNTVKEFVANPSLNYGLAIKSSTVSSTIYTLNDTFSRQPYLYIITIPVITGFTGTPQTSTSIKWTWNTLTEASKYRIYDKNGILLQEIVGNTSTQWIQTGLTPNTLYDNVQIKYVDTNGVEQSAVSSASVTTYATLLPAKEFLATNISSNSIIWTWNKNLIPLFDSPNWTKNVGVTINTPTKVIIVRDTSVSQNHIGTTMTVNQNTKYNLKCTISGVHAYINITGYPSGTAIVDMSAENDIIFSTGSDTSITLSFTNFGLTGTQTFENPSLYRVDDENKDITAYEILDKNGVLLYSTPDANTKTWTENNLRYSSNYIRQIRVNRNGEKSSAVQVSATTSDRSPKTGFITTISITRDTFVDSNTPTTVYDNDTVLYFGRNSTSINRTFLYCPLDNLPKGATFSGNSYLNLKYNIGSGKSNVYKVNQNWSNGINWNTQPTYDPTLIWSGTFSGVIGSEFLILPSTLMDYWYNNPSLNFGIVVLGDETITNSKVSFYSTDYVTASYRPFLNVYYDIFPPLKPITLSGTVISSSSIRWSWNAGDNTATEYRIYNADTDQLLGTTTSTSFDESGILLGNTYNRYVTAYNSGGESPVTSTSLTTSPLANFRGIPQTSTSIKWAFDLYTTVDKIIIYDENNIKKTEVLSGTTEWVETGLLTNTTYTRKARYVKNGVEDTNYQVASNTTYQTLVVPQNLLGTVINSNTITWSWDDTLNQGITGFEILDKYNNVKYTCTNTVKSWTEKQLRYTTIYDRYIRTVRNGEKSGLVQVTATTQDRPINVDEMTTTETLQGNFDSYLNSASTGTNYGTATTLYVGKNSTTLYRTLLNFNTSGITTDRILKSAKLRVYKNAYTGTPSVVDVFKSTQTWTETGVTWTNQPTYLSTKLGSLTFLSTTGQYYETNLSIDNLQSWIKNGDNYGLLLKSDETSSGYITLNSRENTYNSQLIVTHEVPVAPLSPSNFKGSLKTGSSVLWTWTETTSINAQGYRIYNADNDQLIVDLPMGVNGYEETGLVMGTTYNRYIVSYNIYGESQIVSTSYLFDQFPPSNIVGNVQSSSRIIWTFDDVGYKEYRIYPYNASTGTGTEIARIKYEGATWNTYLKSDLTKIVESNATPKWEQHKLIPNTSYGIKVSSYTTIESRLSNAVTVMTNTLPNMTVINGQKLDVNNLKWTIS